MTNQNLENEHSYKQMNYLGSQKKTKNKAHQPTHKKPKQKQPSNKETPPQDKEQY